MPGFITHTSAYAQGYPQAIQIGAVRLSFRPEWPLLDLLFAKHRVSLIGLSQNYQKRERTEHT